MGWMDMKRRKVLVFLIAPKGRLGEGLALCGSGEGVGNERGIVGGGVSRGAEERLDGERNCRGEMLLGCFEAPEGGVWGNIVMRIFSGFRFVSKPKAKRSGAEGVWGCFEFVLVCFSQKKYKQKNRKKTSWTKNQAY